MITFITDCDLDGNPLGYHEIQSLSEIFGTNNESEFGT